MKYILVFMSVLFFHLEQIKAADHKEEDLNLSRSSFLISGCKYNDLKRNDNGVITLCFSDTDHLSLVFECFSPKDPDKIYLSMVHYSKDENCWGMGSRLVQIDSAGKTLVKTYRGVKISMSKEEILSPSYKKYASWILPNKDLISSLTEVEKEVGEPSKYSSNEFDYICNVMNLSGIRNTDFDFLQSRNSENMKNLVRNKMIPKPNKIY